MIKDAANAKTIYCIHSCSKNFAREKSAFNTTRFVLQQCRVVWQYLYKPCVKTKYLFLYASVPFCVCAHLFMCTCM